MDPTFNQQIRIAFQVEGQAALDRLQAQIDEVTEAMRQEAQALALGYQDFPAYITATTALAEEHVKLTGAMAGCAASAGGVASKLPGVGSAAGEANGKVAAMSRGFLDLSRAMEDVATGGVAGGLNNLPGIFGNFGQAAGMTTPQINAMITTVTMLGTAALVTYKNWDTITKLFQGGIPRPILDTTAELERKLDTAKKTTEELGKESSLTVSQMLEYRKAAESVKVLTEELRQAKELQDMLDAKSKGQRERGSGFKEAVSESGGTVALDELRQALNTQEDASGKVFDPVTNSMRTAEEAAKSMMVAAGGGDQTAIDAVNQALSKAFGDRSGFAANIRKFSPEGKAMAKQGQAHVDILDKFNEAAEKADSAAEDRKTDMLNAQGDEHTKEVKAIQGAQKKEATDTLGQFKGTMSDDLSIALLKRMMRGQGADIAGAALAPQAREAMIRAGADPSAAFDASYQLIESVKGGVNAQLADRGGVNPQSIMSLMAEMSQKAAAKDLAGQRREQGLDKASALGQQATMFQGRGFSEGQSAELARDTIGLMSKGLSMQEAQEVAIAQMRQELQQIQQRMNGLGQRMQRGRQRQPTLLNQFPPGVR